MAILKADGETALDRSSWATSANTLHTRSVSSQSSVFAHITAFVAAMTVYNEASLVVDGNQLISSGAQSNAAGVLTLSVFIVIFYGDARTESRQHISVTSPQTIPSYVHVLPGSLGGWEPSGMINMSATPGEEVTS